MVLNLFELADFSSPKAALNSLLVFAVLADTVLYTLLPLHSDGV